MQLELNDTQREQLHRILTRAGEMFGDSKKLEKMVGCWDDLAARLEKGECTFELSDDQARYLRKACMGARSSLRKRADQAGFLTRRAVRKALEQHTPLFDMVLPRK